MAVNVISLTSEGAVMCAWCLQEQGLISAEHPPKEGESHGICKGHAYLLRMRRQVNRMPLLINQNATVLRQYSLMQR